MVAPKSPPRVQVNIQFTKCTERVQASLYAELMEWWSNSPTALSLGQPTLHPNLLTNDLLLEVP